MDQGQVAALAVGGTLGLAVTGVLRAPLWAGILMGVGGAVATLVLIDVASGVGQAASNVVPPSGAATGSAG